MTKEILNNVLRNDNELIFIIGNKYCPWKRDEVLKLHCHLLDMSKVYHFALNQIGKEYGYALQKINSFVEDIMYRDALKKINDFAEDID